jgi:hypothetical protein
MIKVDDGEGIIYLPISQSISRMITKECLNCQRHFDSETWWNKDYCDERCRITAARKRRKARASWRPTNTFGTKVDGRLADPTVKQLEEFARVLLGGSDNTPRQFRGQIPQWKPPQGLDFIQDAMDATTWILIRSDGVTENEVKPTFKAIEILPR